MLRRRSRGARHYPRRALFCALARLRDIAAGRERDAHPSLPVCVRLPEEAQIATGNCERVRNVFEADSTRFDLAVNDGGRADSSEPRIDWQAEYRACVQLELVLRLRAHR